MDWTKLPDLIAVGLLTLAFSSVARKSHEPASAHWLNAWVLILLHFFAFMFASAPGALGTGFTLAGTLFLAWAGVLFMRASVPYQTEPSNRTMLFVLLGCYSLYICALQLNAPEWLQMSAATIMGIAPLAVALYNLPKFNHFLRWLMVSLQVSLAVFLVWAQHRPDHTDMGLNACLFVVYLACGLHFLYRYRRTNSGALISTTGFFLWSAVFVVAPALTGMFPNAPMESEVWNLPKYIVAVGMILLLLEQQIVHNKHLALHDELTGLPNRRLFQDRLASALERARRHNAQTALLMIDLDHFKQVNDTLGHHAGDLVLQSVSQLFLHRVRRSDTVARTGGDEFAIILDSPTSPREAAHVAKNLLGMLNEPMAIKDGQVCVGASVGVAVFPDDAQDMEALCIKADLRMYDEKRVKPGRGTRLNGRANGLKSQSVHKPGIESPQ